MPNILHILRSYILCTTILLTQYNILHAQDNSSAIQSPESQVDYSKIQPDEHFLGHKDAPVTMIIYLSFSCPHCAVFKNQVIPKIQKDYVDKKKVKLAIRTIAMDKPAYEAVALINCIEHKLQPKMQDILFDKQQNWLFSNNFEQELKKIAKIAGISEEHFMKCINNKDFENKFLTKQQAVHQQFNLNATPMIIINGIKFVEMPNYNHIEQAIEKSLAKSLF